MGHKRVFRQSATIFQMKAIFIWMFFISLSLIACSSSEQKKICNSEYIVFNLNRIDSVDIYQRSIGSKYLLRIYQGDIYRIFKIDTNDINAFEHLYDNILKDSLLTNAGFDKKILKAKGQFKDFLAMQFVELYFLSGINGHYGKCINGDEYFFVKDTSTFSDKQIDISSYIKINDSIYYIPH
jgi:hypothetical protein